MTFFYDLNKKLDGIRAKPETTHKQLNERDEGKPGKNFEKIAKDAGERYGSKAAGERVAGAVRNKLKDQGKLEEEGMSRAAKGYEKYGKQGMEALAKAGREGRALDPVRKKYDKYDEGIEDRIGDLDMTNPVNQPAYQRKAAAQGGGNKVSQPPIIGNRREGYPRMSGGAPVPEMPKSREGYPRFSGGGGYTGKGVKEEGSDAMTPKQKSFAKLAPPADKITFADKIAGAKKEVDEMLGDVAAEAMKSALSGGQKKLDKNNNGRLDANDFAMLRAGKGKQETDEGWDDMVKDAERRRAGMKTGEKTQGHKGEIEKTATGIRHTRRYDPKTGETDAGDDASTSGEKRGRGRPKGSKASIGAKGPSGKSKLMTRESSQQELDEAIAKLEAAGYTVEKAPPGAKAERMVKHIKAGYADDGKITDREKGIAYATAWKAKKAGKVEEESDEQRDEKAEKAGRRVAKDIEYDEKAKDKIHGKKRGSEDDKAEKAGKKVTKDIEYDEKKKKVKEQGGAETPTASSGFSFGKGIYDSMNRELESMISESMNVSMNMNTDANGGPSRSLTVTATDDDAMKLGALLKNAGLGGDHDMGDVGPAEVEIHGAEDIADQIRQALGGDHGSEEVCGDCGHAECECDHEEVDEAYGDTAVDENNPDFPTNTEYNSDSLQYSGGLNKPKPTGQTTIPVIASQDSRQKGYGDGFDEVYEELSRIREMAGLNHSHRLDEGMMDKIKGMLVPKLMKLLGADAENIANAVRQATGGDLTPSKENAMKVVQALGINKAAGQGQSQMAEGIAGNWQGKLIQSLYTLGLLGSAGAAMSMSGTVGGNFAGVIGILLLMFANTFFGEAPGQIGAFGKFGNKGTSSQRGLDDHGMPIRNMNVSESDDTSHMMEMSGSKEDMARRIYQLASQLHTLDRMYAQDDPKLQAELDQLQAQFTQQYPGEDAFELGGKVDRARGQDERQSTAQAATLQKARQGIGGMYESEESQDDTADADLKRMREMAGIKEAKKVDEDDMEEGNKFTGNLAKARAAGKKEADLDGDGTMEKVDEGILASTASLWKQYKGQYGV